MFRTFPLNWNWEKKKYKGSLILCCTTLSHTETRSQLSSRSLGFSLEAMRGLGARSENQGSYRSRTAAAGGVGREDFEAGERCQDGDSWRYNVYHHIYNLYNDIYTLIFLDHIWYRLGYVRNSRLYGGFTRTYGHLGSPIPAAPLDHTGNN